MEHVMTTSNEVAPVIHRPEIRCSLTIEEFNAVVEKVIDALPDNLDDEWLAGLEDTIDFPPISEEKWRKASSFAFWQAARVTIEGLVKHGLAAEPLIASVEVITGTDRSTFEACTAPEQCLLRVLGDLSGCGNFVCRTTSK
jgi:hypothetical protein